MNFLTKDITAFTDDELAELDRVLHEEVERRENITRWAEIKKLIGKKHIRVKVDHDDEYPRYGFFLVKGKTELDFYYGVSDSMREKLLDAIPPGFSECMENCYEYQDDDEAARKVLAQCGITDIVEVTYQ